MYTLTNVVKDYPKGRETVHALRRALKRWRAHMRLLDKPLGEEADHMRLRARELMRSVAGARDAQGALDAIADLRKHEATLSERSLQTICGRLTEMRS